MMKKITLLSVLYLFLINASIWAQVSPAADKILGLWLSEEKDGKIEIFRKGDKFFGRLIWGKNMYEADGITSKKDVNNSDETLSQRELRNLVILSDFTFDKNVWTGGQIYDPQSGKTYSCTLRLNGTSLDIRGFVGISLFGRTSVWTRAK